MYFKIMGLFFGLVILNCLLFINLKKLSNFINVFDKPDNKLKKHTVTTPLLGGTIFVINFSLIILFIFIFDYKFPHKEIFLIKYTSIFFFHFFIFYLGYY